MNTSKAKVPVIKPVLANRAKPVTKFIFDKIEYQVKITFGKGLSFYTIVPRVDILNKGQTKEGLFKALVDIADRMDLPSPRLYNIEGLRKAYTT